ncbi:hypothetical protein GGI26_002398 [Coemansia sp. RSA 1358]|nr:hypothetical protein EDC05_002914 [Coemansia umbellata]KAJ2623360.1 hypothetical protein GGI26_002398 [Coemansia sp. RSA 1358]
MDGSDRKQSARRYASINTIPPLQDCASSTHSALAAAAAPIANLASPTRPRQSLDESAMAVPLVSGGSASPFISNKSASDAQHSPRRRSSISSCESISERKANLPFTYSGVFSQNFWNDIDAVSRSKVQPADDLENSTVNFNTDSPYSAATARAADKRRIVGGTITNGHFSLHEASSALAHSNRSGIAFADEPSSDNESESMSDDDDSDSSESYEGLAVDDINETYNQDLPEYVSNRDPYAQKIYLDEEGITIEVVGMSYSSLGVWLYSIVGILSFGIIPLLCRWMPRWKIRWTMRHANLGEADFAVVIDEFGSLTVEPIQHKRYGGTLESIFGSLTRKGPLHEYNNDTVNNLSMFAHRYYRFVYHPYLEKFLPNACWMDSAWTRTPASMRSGISSDLRDLRRSIFGQNNIDIKEKPAGRLLVDEVLNPFYVFQAGSVVLWCLENYYYYAACILLISVSGIVETLVETRRNTRKIKEMAHFSCFVRILRDGAWRDSNSEELLPGDVFEVVSGMHILPCDAVLLEGDCIVNESMLTGESVPVAKVPVVPSVFGKMRLASSTFGSDIAKHVLFSGTKLVRVKRTSVGFGGNRWLDLEQKTLTGMPARATAMVLRTGFNTTKGALVRSILFPRPNKFKFYEDSFRFIGVLAMIAIIGFLASIGNFLRLGLTARVIAIRALDLVTVVVPPALPATMSIGVSFALSRLRRRHIYCISPTRINVCGKINVMCFDKTGTLTEEGLDVLGVCTMDYDTCRFKEIQEDPSQLLAASAAPPSAPSSAFSSVGSAFAMGLPGGLADLDRSSSMTSTPRRAADPSKISVLHALATCHAVKLVDGEFVGDPLDVKMFESTGWTLDETDDYSDVFAGQRAATHGSGGVEERALYSDTEPSTGQHNSGNTKPSKKAVPVPTVVRPPNSDRFTLDGIGNANVYELGIIRTFDFSAALRRQSVITKRLGARYNEVYVKGAPEAIRELCYSDTLPRDFDQVLLDYTNHGYRVIALAGKPLKMSWHKIQRLKRDNVEQDLIFMGLLIFENKLKPTTAPVLDELRGAKIRQIMCTGDNVLTAISVGRECRMVPEEMRVFVPRLIRKKETVPVAQTGFGGNSSRCGSAEDGISNEGAQSSSLDVRAMVVWEDVEDNMHVLDPFTLEPRVATSPVKERVVTSDIAETSEEMERQQQLYLSWLHNYTNVDMTLISRGNFCVAITGEVFRYMMDESHELTIGRMLMRGAIYARMSPDEKAELVERLQAIGYCTGFCGDGANDCGALRAADVGLSLSEAEASVAAPFTSHSTDIQCVLDVIREGRAALVTSFSCFKFMALYSIIQFTTVSMLYKFGGNLGDLQFLYIDLFIIIPLAVFMGRTPAFSRIAPKRPTANLMSKKVLTSLFGQIIINSSIQAILFHLVKLSENYTPPVREDPTNPDSLLILSFENTALFLASSFQYVIVACVFGIGPPYRKSNMRNFGFVLTCVVLIVYTTFLVLWPTGWAMDMFELVSLSSDFQHTVVVWAIFNFALSSLGEWWLFPLAAPLVAKSARIAKYILYRYILCTSWRQQRQYSYAKLATGKYRLDSNRYVAEDIEGNGSPSETIGGHEHHIGYTETGSGDLEEGRVQLTWEEIARKKEIKPFKQILRDMGIPAWY